QAFSAPKLCRTSIAFVRSTHTFSLVRFADKTSFLNNDLGRSRDKRLGSGALDGVAGTRLADLAAIARLDRDAHRALGGKAAFISDHILFCSYCRRSPSDLVRILEANPRLSSPLVACVSSFSLLCGDNPGPRLPVAW